LFPFPNWLDILLQDVRFALRAFAKAPGFAAIVFTTLALGVGANTASFGILKAVSLKQLPYVDPDRLVAIADPTATPPARRASHSPPFAISGSERNPLKR
jgi:hypothetical protein